MHPLNVSSDITIPSGMFEIVLRLIQLLNPYLEIEIKLSENSTVSKSLLSANAYEDIYFTSSGITIFLLFWIFFLFFF